MTTLAIIPLFIGTTELLLIGGLALLMFGGKKLPEMMRGLGQGVQNFKKGMNDPMPEGESEVPATDNQESAEAMPSGASISEDNKAEKA